MFSWNRVHICPNSKQHKLEAQPKLSEMVHRICQVIISAGQKGFIDNGSKLSLQEEGGTFGIFLSKKYVG